MNFRAFRFWAPLAIAAALFLTSLTLNAEPAAPAADGAQTRANRFPPQIAIAATAGKDAPSSRLDD